ncbi:BREX-3 system P-loop-containing protein BrxF [Desulfofundulus thermobenzoicus]|uniref:BREX-3 system P-loop-containing protein BrxF n=1 Tax=Desulfofundulus thermobenzoicus TaxID=29376 RepID=A0A6N7IS22_9FIRM|nr:BREX-3 system P-loop-containing protein BrxF [Desulfofundulus thermobenzoicus]MQL52309.1 BREX-3 system P-loop-containing protein BrxF [Desulfofundulus thermobenzoicus]
MLDEIVQLINQAAGLYYRLILVVAPAGKGKTRMLQELHKLTGAPLLNVNLELSRRLLDLTERRRALRIARLLSDIVNTLPDDLILLDNTEILFDVALRQDALRLLQGLSRNRTIVAAWNGRLESGYLTYAVPNHREYRRYPVRDYLVLNLEPPAGG